MKRLDISGERYGKLLALQRIEGAKGSRWIFKCECGRETSALLSNVRGGSVRSCGCAGSRSTIGLRSVRHGHSVGFKKSKTATAWRNAKTRCFNPKHEKYAAYGERGITMCKEWADDFRVFLHDMGECPSGLTLERIDVDGNYEPGNCRWATPTEQSFNKRESITVSSMPLKSYAAAVGVSYKRLHYRIAKHGETPQEAARWYITRRRPEQNKTHTSVG
jgi:hypothetical protein